MLGIGISYQDKLFFTKHLSIMTASGIPLAESLDTLEEQAKSGKFKKIIKSLAREVENGQSLEKALAKHKKVFGEFYISLIKVGESSGTLDKTLEFLAGQMSKDFALRKKVQAALFYPAIIFSAALIMGSFIAFFILPKLVEFFEAFDIELPLATRILLGVAYAFQNYGIVIAAASVLTIFLFVTFTRNRATKPIWHALLLSAPLIGNFTRYVQLARVTRNLGTLITSGIPLAEAVKTTAETMTNISYKKDMMRIKKELEDGKSISEALSAKRYKNFPPVAVKMIGVGERTGKLDETLLYLSDFFEEEIDNISKNLSTVIEPILLIAIGLGVGVVALAIISPIYELTGSIRR